MSSDTLGTLRTILSDRYRVERLLGSGGMATVYLAHDLKHDRPVAIKVLRPQIAASLGPERFLREIQIAAKLTHPHILSLHDSGEADGLLYFVMPYVAGESLLDRLHREKQLSVEEAVRITREVAAALTYAHARDVVHRDIKPGNILLSDGYALVADFGLARALDQAQSSITISQTGLTLGTPAYMSPEQATGEAPVDERTDVYALGCVLYELLAGDPPFTASNPAALVARHARGEVVPLRKLRPAVPERIEQAVMKALEKRPADRFRSAEAFADALVLPERKRGLPPWAALATLGIAAATVGIAIWLMGIRSGEEGVQAPPDTTRYAVLPFETVGIAPKDLLVSQLIHDALAQWTGIGVVDHFQIEDALARIGTSGPLTVANAARLARTVSAGRYVRGEVSPVGDSIRIQAGLFDAAGSRGLIRSAMVKLGPDRLIADSAIADLVGQLLLPSARPGERPGMGGGSRSLPARQAMALGEARIQQWDLEAADSAYSTALQLDPEYAEASLWVGLVRMWNGAPPARWRFAAEQAEARRVRLSSRDQLLAQALAAQSRADFPVACATWRRLTKAEPAAFVGWYSLARCIRGDLVILPDRRSPSTWRFRSSYHEAIKAFRQAFLLLPSMHTAFRAGGFQRIRDFLLTSVTTLRPGRALPPDTTTFLAFAEWRGDSLVLVPFPTAAVINGAFGDPAARYEAVRRERAVFREIAAGWASQLPNSADALEALALSLELLGDPSALDTLRHARSRAKDPAEAARVAASEAWLRLKFSLPDDIAGLEMVRALADSLLALADTPQAPDPEVLAGLAALRGRAARSAELSTRSVTRGSDVLDRALARDGPALWAFAASGGPADSLLAMEARVESTIAAIQPEAERGRLRQDWLGRAAILAYPDVTMQSLRSGAVRGGKLFDAQAAHADGRIPEVRRLMTELAAARGGMAPEDLGLDALYPESRLLLALGETAQAARWLDPTLTALRRVAPQVLSSPVTAEILVRSMALRAELAALLGDRATARRWARAVSILWRNPDPFLRTVVTRMTRLAG